jgi:hypothetical protein|tara:strand:- start:537 stop:671 length:135 start_codon:yes stop_codon:yes gene_type:complete
MENNMKEKLYRELHEILESMELRNYQDATEQLDTLIYKVEYNQL